MSEATGDFLMSLPLPSLKEAHEDLMDQLITDKEVQKCIKMFALHKLPGFFLVLVWYNYIHKNDFLPRILYFWTLPIAVPRGDSLRLLMCVILYGVIGNLKWIDQYYMPRIYRYTTKNLKSLSFPILQLRVLHLYGSLLKLFLAILLQLVPWCGCLAVCDLLYCALLCPIPWMFGTGHGIVIGIFTHPVNPNFLPPKVCPRANTYHKYIPHFSGGSTKAFSRSGIILTGTNNTPCNILWLSYNCPQYFNIINLDISCVWTLLY